MKTLKIVKRDCEILGINVKGHYRDRTKKLEIWNSDVLLEASGCKNCMICAKLSWPLGILSRCLIRCDGSSKGGSHGDLMEMIALNRTKYIHT